VSVVYAHTNSMSYCFYTALKPQKECRNCNVGGGKENKMCVLFRIEAFTKFALVQFAKYTYSFPLVSVRYYQLVHHGQSLVCQHRWLASGFSLWQPCYKFMSYAKNNLVSLLCPLFWNSCNLLKYQVSHWSLNLPTSMEQLYSALWLTHSLVISSLPLWHAVMMGSMLSGTSCTLQHVSVKYFQGVQ
jgi:hypothetical protein